MDSLASMYDQQRRNAKILKRRLRFPQGHGLDLPPQVDLRRWMTKIKDQGSVGTCAANAVAASIEYLYKRFAGKTTKISRLFIDYNSRCVHNKRDPRQQYQPNEDGNPANPFGTNRESTLRAVQIHGYCNETSWPYTEELFQKPPPARVFDEAAGHSIIPLRIPVNVVAVKTCLAHQIPVLVGIQLSDDANANYQGWVYVPTSIPKDNEFHACLIVGYNDQSKHFILRNSWGTDWGDRGYGYLPYQYLMQRQLVVVDGAFWAIVQLVAKKGVRRGFYSYPNYTQYHLQNMLPPTIRESGERQLQKRRYQGRRHNY